MAKRIKLVMITVLLLQAPSVLAVAGAAGPGLMRSALCAKQYPGPVPADRWSQAQVTLTPPRAIAMRLCRYSGGNARRPDTLIRTALLTSPRVVGELVRDFDELPPQGPGAIACPSDDGSKIIVLVAYPGGHRITISVGLAGCDSVTNGDLKRLAAGVGTPRPFGPQLVARLLYLTSHK